MDDTVEVSRMYDVPRVQHFEAFHVVTVNAEYGADQGKDTNAPAKAGPEVVHVRGEGIVTVVYSCEIQ